MQVASIFEWQAGRISRCPAARGYITGLHLHCMQLAEARLQKHRLRRYEQQGNAIDKENATDEFLLLKEMVQTQPYKPA